ncbi:protein kinase, partial [Exiguobacterium sp. BRG2]|uniref:protein kinase domain-containing protein n=1 Tax=Exiguobacterium sp. BRG2 TaxID=2962584 RepID=UPI0028825359
TKKILHLDIKPTNILIDNSGKAVITDFGLSKYLRTDDSVIQKKAYIPHVVPEMFSTEERTVLTDIYGVGLTLYRMVNGEENFKEQYDEISTSNSIDFKNIILSGKFPDRKSYLPHVPQSIRKIINKALNIDPTKRYFNVLSLLNDLSKVNSFLEWKFIKTGNDYIWIYENTNVIYTIRLFDNSGTVKLEGFKENILTNKRQRINKFFKEYDNLQNAFHDLSKILKEKP